jgi:hypothetical protein
MEPMPGIGTGAGVSYTIPDGSPKKATAAAFGRELVKAYETRGIPRNELWRVTGIGRTALDNYRTGSVLPRTEAAAALAAVLEWPKLLEIVRQARTKACARCGRPFRMEGGNSGRKIYCGPACPRPSGSGGPGEPPASQGRPDRRPTADRSGDRAPPVRDPDRRATRGRARRRDRRHVPGLRAARRVPNARLPTPRFLAAPDRHTRRQARAEDDGPDPDRDRPEGGPEAIRGDGPPSCRGPDALSAQRFAPTSGERPGAARGLDRGTARRAQRPTASVSDS